MYIVNFLYIVDDKSGCYFAVILVYRLVFIQSNSYL